VEQVITTTTNSSKVFMVTKMPWLTKEGHLIGTIGNLTDITAQKQKEFDLQTENNLLKSNFEKIIDAVPGILYWKDKKGVYKGCNDFTVKANSLNSKNEIIGKTDKILWPEYEKFICQNDNKVIQTGQTLCVEENLKGRTYLATKMPLYDENN